ncbi:MAG: ACR3 family arsenite efflux transporter [Flavobacteriales bacterium]|jgi:ACR3 family arsenite transporter|nr:ACR3 family arsenite efflux transporter [Flavobacteriales bacterium]MCB0758539.1 ACR3 family arsenite efflux transporter [Flavobacteriales bacterium]
MTDQAPSIGFFEKYLTAWVLLCIAVGIALGQLAGSGMQVVADLEHNQVNLPVAVLIWLMIYPMMVQIDFGSIARIGRDMKGLSLTVVVNWLVKPFTMAFFAWLFFDHLYSAWLEPELAQEYIAGAILLGAAPCTAMVFVWSYLSGGDPNYTLVQVSVNDLILLVLFVPIVQLLLGITGIAIPMDVLITSVVVFVVIPLVAGYLTNRWLIRTRGEEWFKTGFLPKLKPISIAALLLTLVLLFSFQGSKILANPFHILLIAVPLALQTYFIFFLTWKGGRLLKLPYRTCAPASMIGASNFFELAVAVAIALFGLNSGAALVTVVGVLIEVPIMLHLVRLAKRWRYE